MGRDQSPTTAVRSAACERSSANRSAGCEGGTGRMAIRVGIGGWIFEPWRGSFYPADLAQRLELEYASRKVTAIEINATYYRTQTPASFARWRDQTPAGLRFLAQGQPLSRPTGGSWPKPGDSISRFVSSGIAELGGSSGRSYGSSRQPSASIRRTSSAFLQQLPRSPRRRWRCGMCWMCGTKASGAASSSPWRAAPDGGGLYRLAANFRRSPIAPATSCMRG